MKKIFFNLFYADCKYINFLCLSYRVDGQYCEYEGRIEVVFYENRS